MTTPTLQAIFDHPDQYNNLIPSQGLAEGLPPGVQFRIALVDIKPDPQDGEVYKSGSKKVGDRWTNTFSLGKQALARLLGAAVINVTDGEVIAVPDQPALRRYKAIVKQRSMDGSWRSYPGTADLDIEAEVTAFRAKIQAEISQHGNLERKRWEDGQQRTKKYEGEAARGVMDYEVSEFEARLRKFGASIVETKAILRGIKGILAIKDGYLPAELKRPFVAYWYQFPVAVDPDKAAEQMFPGRASQESGSPSEPDGSHTGRPVEQAPPPKPPVSTRMKMMSNLSEGEIREVIEDHRFSMIRTPQ